MSATPPSEATGLAGPAPRKARGELVALAVLNFVFGGTHLLSSIWSLALAVRGGPVAAWPPANPQAAKQVPEAFTRLMQLLSPSVEYQWAVSLLGLVASTLLIVAGLGYLKRSRTLGPPFAYAWAVVTLVMVVAAVGIRPWLGALTITSLTYPIITVVMLNTTFKNDFEPDAGGVSPGARP
jgi:hypothetical protein